MARSASLALAAALASWSCGAKTATPAYAWQLPEGFPTPNVPDSNPMSEAKVELGRFLFYDERVSGAQLRACASCHIQSFGFTTPAARGRGLNQPTRHNVLALAGAAYMPVYLWADSRVRSIEEVVQQTLVDDNEFGGQGLESTVAERLRSDARYPPLFEEAFPNEAISYDTIAKAIAAFTRTIISGDSPYDRYQRGDRAALGDSAKRGRDLFFSERLECYHCHGGFTLASSVTHQGLVLGEIAYDNTGLYNVDGQGAYPADDPGLSEATGLASDMGRFKAPSLRNVAVTAPYMHDGSIATLSEVLDSYVVGGRSAMEGGAPNPLRSGFVREILPPLSAQERADVLAFLQSLTDSAFLADPRFANPF